MKNIKNKYKEIVNNYIETKKRENVINIET